MVLDQGTGKHTFVPRLSSPYHRYNQQTNTPPFGNLGFIMPNEEGIPSCTNSSVNNNLTSSKNNTGHNNTRDNDRLDDSDCVDNDVPDDGDSGNGEVYRDIQDQ